ncbi:MAG: DUF1592 domain-containing protein [Polyangiaceae bacterium]
MRRARWIVPFGASLLAGVAVAASACNGTIGDPIAPASVDAGRVTLHRLNRAEYNNTIRDLLGTAQTPATDFPADDFSYGFDNIADTLTLSPVQFELYELAAKNLVDEAMLTAIPSTTARFEAEVVGGSVGQTEGSAWDLYSNGTIEVSHDFPTKGSYKVKVRAWSTPAGPDDAQMTVRVGAQTFTYKVPNTSTSPLVVEQDVAMNEGPAVVSVSFDNDYYDDVTMADRNLLVDYIEVIGPIGATSSNPLRDRIVVCDFVNEGDPCLRTILEKFGARAFRHPLAPEDVDALMGLVQVARDQKTPTETDADAEETGLRLAIRAMLTSPRFLFRLELDPDPLAKDSHPLDDYELASRLSYFLWSSMPDDALFAAAAAGTLHEDAELDAQVDRMLADPKAKAMVDNFAGQWLFTRVLANHQADYQKFPTYSPDLAAAMKGESDAFFTELLTSESVGIDQLLTANFTYANDLLAGHYGLPAVGSSAVKRVDTTGTNRGGILRQGSLLTVTSNPDRTSPVKRGKWILTNLLCDSPPDPPANVPPVQKGDLVGKTVREVFEAHRANPICNSCHEVMDQLGFSLENFDAIGAWRTDDNGLPIDATGKLPDGTAFANGAEMADIVGKDARFPKCVLKKLYTYGLGRGAGKADEHFLDDLAERYAATGLELRNAIKLVVKSEPFRTRHGEPATGGGK